MRKRNRIVEFYYTMQQYMLTLIQADEQIDNKTCRQTGGQTHRWRVRQKNTQRERQTNI